MTNHRNESSAVIDQNCVAIEKEISCQNDFAWCWSFDFGSKRCRYIESTMRVSRQPIKNPSKPEQTSNCSVDRLKKRPKIGWYRGYMPISIFHRLLFFSYAL